MCFVRPALQGGPGSGVSDYSHGTGFLNWWGWDPVAYDRTYMADVTAPASRGSAVLQVRQVRDLLELMVDSSAAAMGPDEHSGRILTSVCARMFVNALCNQCHGMRLLQNVGCMTGTIWYACLVTPTTYSDSGTSSALLSTLCCSYQVSSTAGMSVGQWVRINMDDPGDGSLVVDMNGGLMDSGKNQKGAKSIIRHLSRISKLGTNWIQWVPWCRTAATSMQRRPCVALNRTIVRPYMKPCQLPGSEGLIHLPELSFTSLVATLYCGA